MNSSGTHHHHHGSASAKRSGAATSAASHADHCREPRSPQSRSNRHPYHDGMATSDQPGYRQRGPAVDTTAHGNTKDTAHAAHGLHIAGVAVETAGIKVTSAKPASSSTHAPVCNVAATPAMLAAQVGSVRPGKRDVYAPTQLQASLQPEQVHQPPTHPSQLQQRQYLYQHASAAGSDMYASHRYYGAREHVKRRGDDHASGMGYRVHHSAVSYGHGGPGANMREHAPAGDDDDARSDGSVYGTHPDVYIAGGTHIDSDASGALYAAGAQRSGDVESTCSTYSDDSASSTAFGNSFADPSAWTRQAMPQLAGDTTMYSFATIRQQSATAMYNAYPSKRHGYDGGFVMAGRDVGGVGEDGYARVPQTMSASLLAMPTSVLSMPMINPAQLATQPLTAGAEQYGNQDPITRLCRSMASHAPSVTRHPSGAGTHDSLEVPGRAGYMPTLQDRITQYILLHFAVKHDLVLHGSGAMQAYSHHAGVPHDWDFILNMTDDERSPIVARGELETDFTAGLAQWLLKCGVQSASLPRIRWSNMFQAGLYMSHVTIASVRYMDLTIVPAAHARSVTQAYPPKACTVEFYGSDGSVERATLRVCSLRELLKRMECTVQCQPILPGLPHMALHVNGWRVVKDLSKLRQCAVLALAGCIAPSPQLLVVNAHARWTTSPASPSADAITNVVEHGARTGVWPGRGNTHRTAATLQLVTGVSPAEVYGSVDRRLRAMEGLSVAHMAGSVSIVSTISARVYTSTGTSPDDDDAGNVSGVPPAEKRAHVAGGKPASPAKAGKACGTSKQLAKSGLCVACDGPDTRVSRDTAIKRTYSTQEVQAEVLAACVAERDRYQRQEDSSREEIRTLEIALRMTQQSRADCVAAAKKALNSFASSMTQRFENFKSDVLVRITALNEQVMLTKEHVMGKVKHGITMLRAERAETNAVMSRLERKLLNMKVLLTDVVKLQSNAADGVSTTTGSCDLQLRRGGYMLDDFEVEYREHGLRCAQAGVLPFSLFPSEVGGTPMDGDLMGATATKRSGGSVVLGRLKLTALAACVVTSDIMARSKSFCAEGVFHPSAVKLCARSSAGDKETIASFMRMIMEQRYMSLPPLWPVFQHQDPAGNSALHLYAHSGKPAKWRGGQGPDAPNGQEGEACGVLGHDMDAADLDDVLKKRRISVNDGADGAEHEVVTQKAGAVQALGYGTDDSIGHGTDRMGPSNEDDATHIHVPGCKGTIKSVAVDGREKMDASSVRAQIIDVVLDPRNVQGLSSKFGNCALFQTMSVADFVDDAALTSEDSQMGEHMSIFVDLLNAVACASTDYILSVVPEELQNYAANMAMHKNVGSGGGVQAGGGTEAARLVSGKPTLATCAPAKEIDARLSRTNEGMTEVSTKPGVQSVKGIRLDETDTCGGPVATRSTTEAVVKTCPQAFPSTSAVPGTLDFAQLLSNLVQAEMLMKQGLATNAALDARPPFNLHEYTDILDTEQDVATAAAGDDGSAVTAQCQVQLQSHGSSPSGADMDSSDDTIVPPEFRSQSPPFALPTTDDDDDLACLTSNGTKQTAGLQSASLPQSSPVPEPQRAESPLCDGGDDDRTVRDEYGRRCARMCGYLYGEDLDPLCALWDPVVRLLLAPVHARVCQLLLEMTGIQGIMQTSAQCLTRALMEVEHSKMIVMDALTELTNLRVRHNTPEEIWSWIQGDGAGTSKGSAVDNGAGNSQAASVPTKHGKHGKQKKNKRK